MSTVHVRGLRGKYSPMNTITEEHKDFLIACVNEAKFTADFEVTIRYSVYIGPNCAAERDGITVTQDGRIYAIVFPDGHRE
jgi:hypothetical protein